MAELVHSNPKESGEFLQKIGYELSPQVIVEAFPVYFPERRVIHTRQSGQVDRVLKIRPTEEKAENEITKLTKLIKSYGFSGLKLPGLEIFRLEASRYTVINMPYLGVDLTRLGTELDLVELGEIDKSKAIFNGFKPKEADKLVDDLRKNHLNFANQSGLIHGDLFQMKSPNNVLFNNGKLILVDAEAMNVLDDETLARFHEQMDKVQDWVLENLVVID